MRDVESAVKTRQKGRFGSFQVTEAFFLQSLYGTLDYDQRIIDQSIDQERKKINIKRPFKLI